MGAPVRVELGEHIVEEQQWGTAVLGGEEIELGKLEGENCGSLLAPGREAGQIATVELEREVVAVRPDERGSIPDLLLRGLDETSRERVARHFAGKERGVRDVSEAQPGGRCLVGRD